MRTSNDRILTTHVGSLPRATELFVRLRASENAGDVISDELAQMIRRSVEQVVQKQVDLGIDIVNDGEHSKSSFSSYTARRLNGFEPVETVVDRNAASRDRRAFPGAYEDHAAMCAARPLRLATPRARQSWACTGPVSYRGHENVAADIENLRRAVGTQRVSECFITALSPNNVALYYPNRYYKTDQEYYTALADAMREEFLAIVDAGFTLQIDDPRLATHYDRHPDVSIEECRAFIAEQVELINYALRGIPPEKVRFHTCYSTNIAPRAHDLELRHYVDLMLKINAAGYSFEGANPRHEHEWAVWQECRLPDGKLLIPGVVSHCVSLIEHPELVAQRICRFAEVVGRERVIASNDCGFATSSAGDEVHPEVAWAKLRSLSEGAEIASRRLWGKG
ncbi:MAG: cobalamin-independent methionine synthase II family protein [Beijerinckiaceae bacterium]|nr:cobalamin-independent methionine synthase II family protein [Beijerinckiaceae bacterium]